MSDILELIKKRTTIRKYRKKKIPKKILDKIIEAGRCASSIHGFQPWKFVVVRNKKVIKRIGDILYITSQETGTGANILIKSSASTISGAPTIIVVYNSGSFSNFASRFKDDYVKIAILSEELAIAAAIQNMILTAESLSLGSCWFATPLFCPGKLNKLLNVKGDRLVSLLSLGYPLEQGKRSQRISYKENVRFLD